MCDCSFFFFEVADVFAASATFLEHELVAAFANANFVLVGFYAAVIYYYN